MINISVIHPSRSRPIECEKTLSRWIKSAHSKSNFEYILSCDKNDRDLSRYKQVGLRNGIYVSINNNKSAIEAINRAARVSTGRIIIQIADDFNEPPLHWDKLLLEALEGKEDFIVKTKDGIQKTLLTLPLMDRTYYNRFGYIYHPSYLHMYSDEELTCVAHMLGKVIDLDLVIAHNHYSTGKTKKDNVNDKNNRSYPQGENNIRQRKKINFGLQPEQIVKHWSEIVWH